MKRTLIVLASSVLCATAFSSCSKTETKTTANVMIVQASPSVQLAKITTDETAPYATQLLFGMNTGYVRMESGTRTIKMDIGDTSALNVTIAPLVADNNYSVFVVDSDSGKKVSSLVLTDNLTIPAGNKSHIRFIHLSPNAIPVDVVINTKEITEDTVFNNQAFKAATDFMDYNPGVYNMHIRRHGTSDTVCHIPTFTLSAGKIYTIYLKGFDSTAGKLGASSSLIQHN